MHAGRYEYDKKEAKNEGIFNEVSFHNLLLLRHGLRSA